MAKIEQRPTRRVCKHPARVFKRCRNCPLRQREKR